MTNEDRIAITGIGLVTPAGTDADSVSSVLLSGKSSLRRLEFEDFSTMPMEWGGRIEDETIDSFGLDKIKFKNFSRYVKIGYAAVLKGLIDSGLLTGAADPETLNPYPEARRGVFVSTGVNGENAEGLFDAFSVSRDPEGSLDMRKFATEGSGLVHPKWILTSLSNNLIFFLTSEFGLRGDNNNFTYSSVGGCYALSAALGALETGACDMAIVAGTDSLLNWQAIDDLVKLGILCDRAGAGLIHSMAPYTKNAAGGLPAEGAACLVLERQSLAVNRNAKIYALVSGARCHCGGGDLSTPDPEGCDTEVVVNGLFESLAEKSAVPSEDSKLLVNLNGISISSWDRAELKGFSRAFSSSGICADTLLTSSKPYFGQTYSASFLIDLCVSSLAMFRNFKFALPVPPDRPSSPPFVDSAGPWPHDIGISLTVDLGGNCGGAIIEKAHRN